MTAGPDIYRRSLRSGRPCLRQSEPLRGSIPLLPAGEPPRATPSRISCPAPVLSNPNLIVLRDAVVSVLRDRHFVQMRTVPQIKFKLSVAGPLHLRGERSQTGTR